VDTSYRLPDFPYTTTISSPIQSPERFQPAITRVLKVRPLQPNDVARAAAVISDSFQIGMSLGGWLRPLFRIGIQEDLRHRLDVQAPDQAVCLVAAIGSQARDVVGTIEISARLPMYNPSLSRRYVYISNLAVDNNYRRLGIGRELVAQCAAIASTWGFTEIYLHVMADNLAGQHLYAQLGFEVLSSDQPWHILPWQRPQRLFLRKRLDGHFVTIATD
jgi:ribosomal protein S18 acetylase RimI-like enzyme